jgi:hypothetical protein
MRREAAREFKGFLWNNELSERHPQNARTPAQGIQGFQRQGGECEFIGDSEDEVPGGGAGSVEMVQTHLGNCSINTHNTLPSLSDKRK